MATRKVKLRGLSYWAKVFPENRDLTGFEDALKETGGQTTIDMDLDGDNFAKLKKSKSMLTGKPSPEHEGCTRVKFKRKWEENYGGGAPTVIKVDGSLWDFDIDGFLGNGSTVDVVLSVYDTSRKNIVGTRLEKVIVIEHNEYHPDADDDDDIPETPKAKAAAPKAAPPKDDLEDDIPF